MFQDSPTYIIAAYRTPIGTQNGWLSDYDAAELAAPVLKKLATHCPDPTALTHVIMGNVRGPGGNIARIASLSAGLDVPSITVDRQCGSGLAAIEIGAYWAHARSGYVIAGGSESASCQPTTFLADRSIADNPYGRLYERAPFAPDGWPDPDMGEAADRLSEIHQISRERQDAYASRSHQRAIDAIDKGLFADEIVPIGQITLDQRPRRRFTPERLARFRPIFRPSGTVTAANSCGINDGAAGVLICDESSWVTMGRPSALKIKALSCATCDTDRPGWGIVPAVRAVLDDASIAIADIDLIECNEAFAGQVLTCLDALGIDEERCCLEGGALALGHPWGASGAVLVTRLFTQMVRHGRGHYGLAAIAIGGGQGMAILVEKTSHSSAEKGIPLA